MHVTSWTLQCNCVIELFMTTDHLFAMGALCQLIVVCVAGCEGDQLAEFESEKADMKEKLSAKTENYNTMKKLVHKLQDELSEHGNSQATSSQPVADETATR